MFPCHVVCARGLSCAARHWHPAGGTIASTSPSDWPCLQALAPFAETLEAQHIREDVLPAFVDLTRDDQDSVRLIAGKAAGAAGTARLTERGRCNPPHDLAFLTSQFLTCCSGGGRCTGQAAVTRGGGSNRHASGGAVLAGQVVARALQCGAAGMGSLPVAHSRESVPKQVVLCAVLEPSHKPRGALPAAASTGGSPGSGSSKLAAAASVLAAAQVRCALRSVMLRKAEMPVWRRRLQAMLDEGVPFPLCNCAGTTSLKCARLQPASCRRLPG